MQLSRPLPNRERPRSPSWGGGGGGSTTRCSVVQFQLMMGMPPSPAYRLRRNVGVALATGALCSLGTCLVYAGIAQLANDIIIIVGFVLLGAGLAVLIIGISYATRDRKARRVVRTTDCSAFDLLQQKQRLVHITPLLDDASVA